MAASGSVAPATRGLPEAAGEARPMGAAAAAADPAQLSSQHALQLRSAEQRRGRAWVSPDAAAESLHPGFVVVLALDVTFILTRPCILH